MTNGFASQGSPESSKAKLSVSPPGCLRRMVRRPGPRRSFERSTAWRRMSSPVTKALRPLLAKKLAVLAWSFRITHARNSPLTADGGGPRRPRILAVGVEDGRPEDVEAIGHVGAGDDVGAGGDAGDGGDGAPPP